MEVSFRNQTPKCQRYDKTLLFMSSSHDSLMHEYVKIQTRNKVGDPALGEDKLN